LNKISQEQLKFLGFSKQKSLEEFYPRKAFPTNGTIGVTGKIANEKASVTALFGYGNKVVFSKQIKLAGVNCSEPQSKKLEKLMVIKKINLLENQYKLNKKEITDLGIKYRLVTKNTSLLVLDRLEDYLQHRIVPPLELQKEYFKQLKEIEKQEKGQKTNHLNTVKTSFNQQFNWYKKDFKRKTPKKNVAQAITNTTSNLPIQNPPTEGNVNHSTEHSEETTTEQNTTETEREVIRGGTWKDVGNDEVTNSLTTINYAATDQVSTGFSANGTLSANSTSASYSVSTGNATYSWDYGSDKNSDEVVGAINVKGWDPKSPYMSKIKKASNMNQAYLIFLTEKKQYGTQPSFFLDVADYFIAKKETQKGLRILSNIAELELENHSLLRVLANKLLQLKQYSIALQLFKDLIELRPEEPQSYRDLGLAYEAMGNYNEAVKQLYHVVKEPFDNRFYGIELIAMNEINAILSKNPEGINLDYIDKKLLKNMPVDIRVVLNWDADNTDVDLWVTDPNGEKCFYSNKLTRAGGRISNDFTQGYGPEEFMIRRAKPGYYKIEAHYYGTTTQSIQGKATLSVQFFKQFGTRHEQKEEITRRLNVTDEVIYLGTFKF
jgi:tetratricopeptide (TPR) repeat protein